MKHILLDSSPLALLSKPAQTQEVIAITNWTTDCLNAGHAIYIPEVIDYEVRRELIRAGKSNGIRKLNSLKTVLPYLPITTTAMLLAADLWAQARQSGYSTADPKTLDIDVILASQAITLSLPATDDLVVATTNVKHLSQFVNADLWTNIVP